ncbi:cysteine desulfurase [Streptococcus porcinus]|uniref:Cysteine desulfurase n=1 Tax=Streptococcus porcinus TaxID=1340 RepID=A0A7W0ASN0_STRPO|nr:cysteine desulfurase [Streptococcus porcinus]MBA2796790.1 cysteine desulfurase [Streptococcus porcinus]
MLDSIEIKKVFPILNQMVNDEHLIYLDNAATTQKPQIVLDRLMQYYHEDNANVHRGVHTLAERATREYEASRELVRQFINAKSTKEVLFTRGTTTGLNWVAQFAKTILQEGDQVLISVMEHHANLIPWQEVCHMTGAELIYVYLKDGEIDRDDLQAKLSPKTKFVSLAHVSNVLGSITPIKEITALAHEHGAYMVVDGAQAVPHMSVDVQELDCDFYVFSGHKMMGPTGIGVLYGKEAVLKQMEPIEFGGEMIDFVYEQEASWKELPWKFEAGTPNIAGAIGLGQAIRYLEDLGMDQVHQHAQALVDYILPKLLAIDGLTLYGPHQPEAHTAVFTFNLDGLHPHDVATALDYEGIAVRAGHHCAQPLLRYLGISSAVRASFYIYNSKEDCDRLVEALLKTKEFFNGTL